MAAWNSPENPNFALFQYIELVCFVSDYGANAHTCVLSYVIPGRDFFSFLLPQQLLSNKGSMSASCSDW